MIKKAFAGLIALLQLLPLSAQQNWLEMFDAPYAGDMPRREGACGSGVFSYQMATPAGEMEPARLLRAHPAGSDDSIRIEFELEEPASVRFQMLNTQGKLVWSTPDTDTGAFRQLDTRPAGNLEPGAYTLQMVAGSQILAQCTFEFQPKL
ncbi:MAG: hypothetical protein L6Q97_03380 [Thermoanaerobaculia bacterium]|nr:hypothetical protein [Thermoanaerobaculia bacterium]